MSIYGMTDNEIVLHLANTFKKWRVDPRAANYTQAKLAERSGVSTTSIKRFEKTGHITLNNLVALMRALHLLESFETLLPRIEDLQPSPLEILEQERKNQSPRRRASRKNHDTY